MAAKRKTARAPVARRKSPHPVSASPGPEPADELLLAEYYGKIAKVATLYTLKYGELEGNERFDVRFEEDFGDGPGSGYAADPYFVDKDLAMRLSLLREGQREFAEKAYGERDVPLRDDEVAYFVIKSDVLEVASLLYPLLKKAAPRE